MSKGKNHTIRKENYDLILLNVVDLLEQSRRLTTSSINAIMTATYWEIGRQIVEVEQRGEDRTEYYGKEIVDRLAQDLIHKFGRGFGRRNLFQMRLFYMTYSNTQDLLPRRADIVQTLSAQSNSNLSEIARRFPLPWSHYVLLLSCKDKDEREFYELESLRGGWTVRQLKRQKDSQFYKRVLLSKNKAAMLKKGEKVDRKDYISPNEEIKDPFVLEFLNLKDEYSEFDLEEAIIKHLQTFLLEMGTGFTFVGRQMRLRIGDEWYRVDLVLFNRRLRCLVIIDLKLGKLTHADIGQMLLYTGYADKHWREEGENPPVGLILCDENNEALVHYTLDNLPNKILAAQYKMILPDERVLIEELKQARKKINEIYS